MPTTYAVGKPYLVGRTVWADGVALFDAPATQLVLFLGRPSASELAAVRRGAAAFALVPISQAVLFLYRFCSGRDGIPWGDAPYTPHLTTTGTTGSMPALPTSTSRYLLTVILVDAATGLIAALRQVTLEPAFSRELAAQVTALAEKPWAGSGGYDAALAEMYRRYPQTVSLLGRAVSRMDVTASSYCLPTASPPGRPHL